MKVLALTILMWFIPVCFPASEVYCQRHVNQSKKSPSLPLVFQLGEFDKQYETALPEYVTLLDASKGDMKTAYSKLISMMRDMEAYAEATQYDLKGIHAWMHFFWKKDGSIEHIGFYLKPHSRNVNTDELKSFLENFARQYQFPLQPGFKYSHYSSFSFPLVTQRKKSSENDKSTARSTSHPGY